MQTTIFSNPPSGSDRQYLHDTHKKLVERCKAVIARKRAVADEHLAADRDCGFVGYAERRAVEKSLGDEAAAYFTEINAIRMVLVGPPPAESPPSDFSASWQIEAMLRE